MTVKHKNLLNLIIGCLYVSFFGLHVSVILMTIIRSVRAKVIGCLYVSFFGLHVSVILMTIIRSVRAKEIIQQRFSLNVMGFHYV